MQQINERDSRDMEACGWDDEFWEEIGLGDLVDGHHAKIGIFEASPKLLKCMTWKKFMELTLLQTC